MKTPTPRSIPLSGLTLSGGRYYSDPANVPGGGDFDVSGTYFYDPFNQGVARTDNSATKLAKFSEYFTCKDNTVTAAAAGEIWTSNRAGVISQFGHDPGPFPGVGGNCLVIEAYPSTGTLDEGSGRRQTDLYLQYNGLRPKTAIRYWSYIIPGGTTSRYSKRWYTASIAAGGTPYGAIILSTGWGCEEHLNSARSSGARSAFEAGTVPHDRWYYELTAAGYGGIEGNARLENDNASEPPRHACYMNIDLNTYQEPGEWVELTFEFDVSVAQGAYNFWMRRYGEEAVHVAGFTGGVTSGYDWSIPTSVDTGPGNAVNINPRTDTMLVKFPSVYDWLPAYPTEGDFTELMMNLQFADSVELLGSHADEP